ncbi:hypothetical protein CANARDRAFT_187393, partial [[Candida] arabinofermentans NRRL YB-2248]
LSSHEELYNLIISNPKTAELFDDYLGSFVYQDQPSTAYSSIDDLSHKRPDMFGVLNIYEKGEILKQREILFTGRSKNSKHKIDVNNFNANFGFDNNDKNYKCIIGDHINYRYEIYKILGQGSFGSVISVKDHKTSRIVAIKIIKNEMQWSLQAVSEVKILQQLNSSSSCSTKPIMKYLEHFNFRSHMCIVTELLPFNMYQLIEATNFKGTGLSLVKSFARDIFSGLSYIHQQGIIHCDLKPENLMLSHVDSKFTVKIIDFGSSCRFKELGYSYLQSRFYRAPEVTLGARYDRKIDVWSVGTILVELFTGIPMFQVGDEYEMINELLAFFGPPSRNYVLGLRYELHNEGPIVSPNEKLGSLDGGINYGTLLWKGFSNDGFTRREYLLDKKPSCKFRSSTKSLKQYLIRNCNADITNYEITGSIDEFADFLSGCFVWNKTKRLECDELLQSPFL